MAGFHRRNFAGKPLGAVLRTADHRIVQKIVKWRFVMKRHQPHKWAVLIECGALEIAIGAKEVPDTFRGMQRVTATFRDVDEALHRQWHGLRRPATGRPALDDPPTLLQSKIEPAMPEAHEGCGRPAPPVREPPGLC